MNVKENVFSSEREFKKALRDTFKFKFKFKFKFSLFASSVVWMQIVVKFNIPLFRYFYNHLSNYTKTIIRLRLVNIGEYSLRLRRIIVNYQAFCLIILGVNYIADLHVQCILQLDKPDFPWGLFWPHPRHTAINPNRCSVYTPIKSTCGFSVVMR